MFGFGKEAKAKEAAKFQYDAMIDISRNSLDEVAEFIASELEKLGAVEPTKEQIKKMEFLQAIIATDMICAELIIMKDHISQKNTNILMRACADEVKNRVDPNDTTSAAIYAWVHQRFSQIQDNPDITAQSNQALHFNSIGTACMLADKYDGDKKGLTELSKDSGFHLRLYENIPRFPMIWVNHLHSIGFD